MTMQALNWDGYNWQKFTTIAGNIGNPFKQAPYFTYYNISFKSEVRARRYHASLLRTPMPVGMDPNDALCLHAKLACDNMKRNLVKSNGSSMLAIAVFGL